jgi:Arc/MetJ family transcription regulator
MTYNKMYIIDVLGGIYMRTTLAIREELLEEVKALSGGRTKREAVEKALEEFVNRRKAKRLIDLEGKIELSFDLNEFVKERRRDVPRR